MKGKIIPVEWKDASFGVEDEELEEVQNNIEIKNMLRGDYGRFRDITEGNTGSIS